MLRCTCQGLAGRPGALGGRKGSRGGGASCKKGEGSAGNPPETLPGEMRQSLVGTDAAGRLKHTPRCSHGMVLVTGATTSHISCSQRPLAGEAVVTLEGRLRKGDYHVGATTPAPHQSKPGIVPSPW